jgi:predicted DNA-binding transcriptional regulator AlpA
MSESKETPAPQLLGEALLQTIRQAVREEIRAMSKDCSEEDRLLTAEEAAKVLSTSADWVYRNSQRLPFTRKLGHKMLRFSAVGIQQYLKTRNVA